MNKESSKQLTGCSHCFCPRCLDIIKISLMMQYLVRGGAYTNDKRKECYDIACNDECIFPFDTYLHGVPYILEAR